MVQNSTEGRLNLAPNGEVKAVTKNGSSCQISECAVFLFDSGARCCVRFDNFGTLFVEGCCRFILECGFIKKPFFFTGRGYWQLDGVASGTYEVELQQGNASILLPLTILPGNPVRVLTSISNESLSQGEVTLLMVWAEDSQGNRVEVVPEQTSITCSSGKASHVKSDTWEIELEEAGTDRSCTVAWSGLISQQFYDVESVLLGGALGSTNTAMSIGLVFLLMIFAVLIVLIRRGSSKEEEWDEYDDEYEYEDEY